ncbi:MAG TPA: polysaccharide deacetylase family protein [Bradyrhizobium sp.]|nr:polysaccharide deacetylase family protein [Bradyrhizobium sp.]
MNAFSEVRARVSHRMAMHLCVRPFRMRNAAPMVSFTFDDVPKSAATTGAAVLKEYGALGTFYVIGSQVGGHSALWDMVDAKDIVALRQAGHEIACHTFSHKRACDLDAEELHEEVDHNQRYLRALDSSIRIENFAYPFGYGSFVRKHQLGTMFRSSRSIVPGINSGSVDLQFLRAMPLIDRRIDRAGIERAFDAVTKNNGWLIFYTHDVADEPSAYGCSPSLLREALQAARKRNIQVLNMAEALQCAGA